MSKLFRILAGTHFQSGREFKKGEVVSSSSDLVSVYPNKFELVVEEKPAPIPAAETPSTFPSSVVPASDPAPASISPDGATPAAAPPTQQATPSEVASKLGRNVSDKYPAAAAKDLLVFQRSSSYHVTSINNPEKALNVKSLKASEVEPFITEQ